MSLQPINPKQVLYIKLGRGGEWERDCITQSQTLRLGYRAIPHELCTQGNWDQVLEHLKGTGKTVGVAARDTDQVRHFYESDENVLWLTFLGDHLYWCFSKPKITLIEDNSKIRPVVGRWQNVDIEGKPLRKSVLSGKLLSMEGFRGTICSVKESKYVVDKINGLLPAGVEAAQQTLNLLEQKLELLISDLHWKDFEILVDLIFRQAGWLRTGILGATEKTIDLNLLSPITSERVGVQIKSEATRKDFEDFDRNTEDMKGYTKYYFVVHTPSSDLLQIADNSEDVKVLLPQQIAKLAVEYGLAKWIIEKAS